MNKRLSRGALTLLMIMAAPVSMAGGFTTLPITDGTDTCTDEVTAAEAALVSEIYAECNADTALPEYTCRAIDVKALIRETKALCASDLAACDIDIQDQINEALALQKEEFTTACGGDTTSVDYECPVLDVLALIDATEAATRTDCFQNPDNCGISISSILDSAKFGETEPNDHIVSADILIPGVPLVGQMYNQADEDWYLVNTTENNSIIEIWFKETSNIWHVDLLDSAGNRLSASDTPGGGDEEFRFDTTVTAAGKYYVVVSNVGDGTDALYQLAAFIKKNEDTVLAPVYNFHDVETEPNNLFTTADPISSNVVTYGQLLDGGDYDVYRFDSEGNEILHLELCYANTSCNSQKEAWKLFLLSSHVLGDEWPCEDTKPDPDDPTLVNDCMFTEPLTTYWYDKSYSAALVTDPLCVPQTCDGTLPNCTPTTCQIIKQDVPGEVSYTDSHIDYLLEYNRFDSVLVGLIDPSAGYMTGIDVSLVEAGTYFVVVAPILRRNENGSPVILDETVQYGPDTYLDLVVEPYIDDQYTFRVTRTLLDPSVADNTVVTAGTSTTATASLDMASGLLSIPEVEYANDIYQMDLILNDQGTFSLETMTPVSTTLP